MTRSTNVRAPVHSARTNVRADGCSPERMYLSAGTNRHRDPPTTNPHAASPPSGETTAALRDRLLSDHSLPDHLIGVKLVEHVLVRPRAFTLTETTTLYPIVARPIRNGIDALPVLAVVPVCVVLVVLYFAVAVALAAGTFVRTTTVTVVLSLGRDVLIAAWQISGLAAATVCDAADAGAVAMMPPAIVSAHTVAAMMISSRSTSQHLAQVGAKDIPPAHPDSSR
jgi:hypothetical protein